MIVLLTFLWIPLKISSYGFVPPDDAHRHVAQAIKKRPLPGVVVMRPEYVMSHNPGWESILRCVRQITGWKADALMVFSFTSLMLALFLAPLPWVRRPEALLAALLAMTVAFPETLTRLTLGRPYLLSEAVLIAILLAWSRKRAPSRWTMIWTFAAIALSTWVHGAWYLWALPVAAFALAGDWAAAFRLAGCCAGGILAGSFLTGHPFVFLKQALDIASVIAHENVSRWMLVGEFMPNRGEINTVLLLAAVYLWRRGIGNGTPATTSPASGLEPGQNEEEEPTGARFSCRPVLALLALSWTLGLYAVRFWTDWGIPAAIVWLFIQFEDVIGRTWPVGAFKRAAFCAAAAIPLALHCSNDLDRRYTRNLTEFHFNASDPKIAEWMPGPDGIFYNNSMDFFYFTYYDNPDAPWRYILGFEPALMPSEDRSIFRAFQASQNAISSLEPWARKLRPVDRMALYCIAKPVLPGLEWKHFGDTLWIGRKLPDGAKEPAGDSTPVQ